MASKAGKRSKDEADSSAAASSSSSVAAADETKSKDENGDDEEEEVKPKKGKKPKTEKKKAPKKEKKTPEGFQFNVNKALDKKHEGKSFAEILELPPSALEGMGNKHDDMLIEFNIATIRDMANWKFFKIARALTVLSSLEEKGKRGAGSRMNFNTAVDKKWEEKSLKEILKAPVSALQGLAKWADTVLEDMTIQELGKWKFFLWAEALVELAKYEDANFTVAK